MSIPGSATPLLLATTAAAAADVQVDRSLRFNNDDQASLSRTPSSAGNRKTFTYSCWFKRANITRGYLFSVWNSDTDSEVFAVNFSSSHTLNIDLISKTLRITDQVFRDPSAWYHLVLAVDTTQSTASDRLKLYINGSQVTSFSTNVDFGQNDDTGVNGTFAHQIGRYFRNSSTEHPFDGYMANIHLIDGQALAPTDFGGYDSDNNWNPKEYSGTYGTNGFHLNFATTSDLGNDVSGNNNDWTPNNLTGEASGLTTAQGGFDILTWSGNNSSGRNITGLSFTPDLVIIKNRTNTSGYAAIMVDIARTAGRYMRTDAATPESVFGYVSAFVSGGFTISNHREVNGSGDTYVGWCWKAGGSASSNTDGSITSNVSVSTTYGFSCLTYTGNGGTGTVGHGLGVVPKWIWIKNRDTGSNGYVYHDALGTSKAILMNQTAGEFTPAPAGVSAVSSSTFSLGGARGETNTSGDDYVAYCWSEVSGFSKFGSYTGNGVNGAGPTVTGLGFEPKFLIIKGSDDSNDNWKIFDNVRSSSNPRDDFLAWNNSDEEIANNNNKVDFLSDGFQIKTDSNGDSNLNNKNYIYMAFAEAPNTADIDSLIDTPTNYEADSGNNGGNYCTFNPVDSNQTHSNGNLFVTCAGGTSPRAGTGTIAVSSGKYYYEITVTESDAAKGIIGFVEAAYDGNGSTIPNSNGNSVFYFGEAGQKFIDGSSSSYGASYGNNDVIGVALNLDDDEITFYKNGSSQGTITTKTFTGAYKPAVGRGSSSGSTSYTLNAGQRPFLYTPPANHKSLCTQNLPDPTIADRSTAMDVVTYTGNGSTQSITGLNFSPEFLWLKSRGSSRAHHLIDVVRGAGKRLFPNLANAEDSTVVLTSFDSNGFSVTAANGSDGINATNDPMVAWAWGGGTSTASNTDGSITSNVRANASAGFSILTYTGTGSAGSIGHGLNAAPELVIIKHRDNALNWVVGHTGSGFNNILVLNENYKAGDTSQTGGQTQYFNDTAPTNSVFSVGNAGGSNRNGENYIALCFSPVENYSAFGTYVGNGNFSGDGPFVPLSFAPAFLLIKNKDTSSDWIMFDNKRPGYNLNNGALFANQSYLEGSVLRVLDLLSNGFKIKPTSSTTGSQNDINKSGDTYIYAAFGDPFKTARAR